MKIVKKIRLILALTIVAVALVASGALANTLSFSNLPGDPGVGNGTNVGFTGGSPGTFTFNDPAGYGHDFSITGSMPAGRPAIGYIGDIEGIFNIGAISGVDPQTALVTSAGVTTFSIIGGGGTFTSTIDMVDIFTFGATGGMNNGLAVNLSNKSYTGTNVDLLGMVLYPTTVNLSFSTDPARNLDYLVDPTNPPVFTAYSGKILYTPVPLPPSALLLGSGLLGLGFLRRKWSLKK